MQHQPRNVLASVQPNLASRFPVDSFRGSAGASDLACMRVANGMFAGTLL